MTMQRSVGSIVIVVGWLLGVVLLATAPGAAGHPVIVVTTDADVVDARDGVTSLREAVRTANRRAGVDRIRLSPGTYSLVRVGTGENTAATGDLDIRGSVTIEGPAGALATVIDGGYRDRVFEVFSRATLTLSGVTVTGGSAIDGGGVYLRPTARLVLGGASGLARIDANEARRRGAGVYSNGGDLVVNPGSEIVGNKALVHGGGVYASAATVTVVGGRIADNEAGGDGGGILSINGAVILTGAAVLATNRAHGAGGGLMSRAGQVTVQAGGAIVGNTTLTGDGEGIALRGGASVLVRGASAITGNAAGGRGSAIANADVAVCNQGTVIDGAVIP